MNAAINKPSKYRKVGGTSLGDVGDCDEHFFFDILQKEGFIDNKNNSLLKLYSGMGSVKTSIGRFKTSSYGTMEAVRLNNRLRADIF